MGLLLPQGRIQTLDDRLAIGMLVLEGFLATAGVVFVYLALSAATFGLTEVAFAVSGVSSLLVGTGLFSKGTWTKPASKRCRSALFIQSTRERTGLF